MRLLIAIFIVVTPIMDLPGSGVGIQVMSGSAVFVLEFPYMVACNIAPEFKVAAVIVEQQTLKEFMYTVCNLELL